MPNLAYVVRDASIPYISKDAKHVLEQLASREGENNESWPSTSTLARCTGISLKGVQRAINVLLANSLITRVSGKLTGKNNHYTVTLPSYFFAEWEAAHSSRRKARKVRQPDLPHVGQDDRGGRPTDAQEVGHPDLQRENSLKEVKQTENPIMVGQSVSSGPSPAAQRQAPAQERRVSLDSLGMVTESERPYVTRLPNGRLSVDHNYAAGICWGVGASSEEAHKFWRFNQAHGWSCLETMSIVDVARRWRDVWQGKHPEEYAQEHERRRESERRRREKDLQAADAAGL